MEAVYILLGAVTAAAIVFYGAKTLHSLAPWIPSKTAFVARAFDFIRPSKGSSFIDLGCGDGRIVFLAHRTYGLNAVGIELSPIPYFFARLWSFRSACRGARIILGDLYTVDLSRYDIIFVYGLPKTLNEYLEPKLTREVRPGSWIISYDFSLATKKPIAEFHERWRNCFVYRF